MGSAERRIREKERRSNDIIDAAERVFFRRGVGLATMDDVAKEAEFSKRTIYLYFNSKEQIYFEIMARGYRRLIGMLNENMQDEKNGNAIDKLKKLTDTVFAFNRDFPDYFKAIMEYENGELDFNTEIIDPSREECYQLGEKIFERLIMLLQGGIAEGSIRSDLDVVQTALVLWSSMIGVFTTAKRKEKYIVNYHHTTPEALVSAAFQFIVRSIQS